MEYLSCVYFSYMCLVYVVVTVYTMTIKCHLAKLIFFSSSNPDSNCCQPNLNLVMCTQKPFFNQLDCANSRLYFHLLGA